MIGVKSVEQGSILISSGLPFATDNTIEFQTLHSW
jgi:hypothetical protein